MSTALLEELPRTRIPRQVAEVRRNWLRAVKAAEAQILDNLRQSALLVEQEIMQRSLYGMIVPERMRALRQNILGEIRRLGGTTEKIINESFVNSIGYGLEHGHAGVMAQMPDAALMAPLDAGTFAGLNVEVQNWLATYPTAGISLSRTIWDTAEDLERRVMSRIARGMALGQNPTVIARDLKRGVPGFGLKPGRVPGAYGSAYKNYLRVARTESARAYRQAEKTYAMQDPMVVGLKWNIGGGHIRQDICLKSGSLIQTDQGSKPIECVGVGDRVLTHAGRYMPVSKLYRHTIRPGWLIQIEVQEGRSRKRCLALTPNHPVLTAEGWISAGDLKAGSSVATVSSVPCGPDSLQMGDNSCKASQGFAQNEPLIPQRKHGGALYDEHHTHQPRKPHSCRRVYQAPTAAQRAGFRLFGGRYRPSNSGSFPRGASLASADEPPAYDETFPVGDSRNSDFAYRQGFYHSTSGNNTSGCFESGRETLSRSPYRPRPPLRGRPDSTRSSNTSHHPARRNILCGTFSSRLGSAPKRGSLGSSIARRTNGRKTFGVPCGVHRPIQHQLTRVRKGNTHNAFRSYYPYRKYSTDLLACQATPVLVDKKEIWSDGEEVFNLGVSGDNSYVANGIVVHNCDDYATVDLFGMGGGVYPPGEFPDLPHPNCGCYSVDQIDRQYVWTGQHDPSLEPTKGEQYVGDPGKLNGAVDRRFTNRMKIYRAQAKKEGRTLKSILEPPEGQRVHYGPTPFPRESPPPPPIGVKRKRKILVGA